jgi:hypothetical protein
MEWDENEVKERILEIENDPRVSLKVPEKLVNPDPLVMEAKKGLSKNGEHSSWSLKNEGVVSNSGSLLIRVAPNNVDRALRLFNTIISVFRARGHHFEVSNVHLGKQRYGISIREKLKKLDEYKKEPTNILCLKVHAGYPRFEIYDSKSVLIEDRISRAVAKVELEVEYFLRVWAENERRAEEQRQREIAKAEILARKKKELDDFKLLLNAAQRHDDVKLIREYIQSKEDKARREDTVNEDLLNWIEWAKKKAEWYDPHIEAYDELLSGVSRATLTFKTELPES